MDQSDVDSTLNDVLRVLYENVSALANISSVDLMNQPFVLQDPDGNFVISNTKNVNTLQATLVTSTAVFASQLGAALVIAVVLLLMTTAEKRKTLPYIFNTLALICDVIRCALQIAQLDGTLSAFPVTELSWTDAPGIPQAIRVSVAGTFFTFLLFVLIQLALITQIRVVCAAASSLQRSIIFYFTVLVGLLAVAFRINLLTLNIRSSVQVSDDSEESQAMVTRAQKMSDISAIVSICIFSAIFCFKLWQAIQNRRSLGLKKFGAMQIIFVMGCQTLFVPAIFTILAYYAFAGAQLQSCSETLVAIFLPLSSIWASGNTNARVSAANHVAIVSVPESRPTRSNVSEEAGATLVGSAAEHSNGSRAVVGSFRPKYDRGAEDSSSSIDRYYDGSIQEAELQEHPVIRHKSCARDL